MAKRLQNQKRSEYHCPPKKCPRPADFARFPELQAYVSAEWRRRMDSCRKWKKGAD